MVEWFQGVEVTWFESPVFKGFFHLFPAILLPFMSFDSILATRYFFGLVSNTVPYH